MKELDPQIVASIVILGWNQVEYTKLCVESVLRHTPEPHELILVDNGSTDETAAFMRSVPGALAIVNEFNRGFAAGNNQGIAAARGKYVVLLNNDTIVTRGWLGQLLEHAEADEQIGMVGPLSNYVATLEQRLAATYTLDNLQKFAVLHARKNDGEAQLTEFLSGFCWLLKRAMVEKVGVLDEEFPIGGFEDNDYCRRVVAAGWLMVIARDTFIHHFGSKSFEGNHLDRSRIQNDNGRRFAEKWGVAVQQADGQGWLLPRMLEEASQHMERGAAADAFDCLARHLEKFPEDAAVLGSAGRILQGLGRLEEARDHLARAMEAAPDEAAYVAEWETICHQLGSQRKMVKS